MPQVPNFGKVERLIGYQPTRPHDEILESVIVYFRESPLGAL
jgi:hypothetical protein